MFCQLVNLGKPYFCLNKISFLSHPISYLILFHPIFHLTGILFHPISCCFILSRLISHQFQYFRSTQISQSFSDLLKILIFLKEKARTNKPHSWKNDSRKKSLNFCDKHFASLRESSHKFAGAWNEAIWSYPPVSINTLLEKAIWKRINSGLVPSIFQMFYPHNNWGQTPKSPSPKNPKSCQVHRQLKVVRGKIPEVKPLADDVVNLREEVSRGKKHPAVGDVGWCFFWIHTE